ncbi:hypothetical protein [Agromyces allii]|uniref:hypothetical protein n=1 Tax=Agromyces allii TaxID=393607 RepID=UPI0014782EE4|nr:hypothetical protein [Agromyces allii]
MWTSIVIPLAAYTVTAIVGFVFEGLLWLAVIGIVLFIGTLVVGIPRRHVRPSV